MKDKRFQLVIGSGVLMLLLLYGIPILISFRHNPIMLIMEMIMLIGMIFSILVISYVLSSKDRYKAKERKNDVRNAK